MLTHELVELRLVEARGLDLRHDESVQTRGASNGP
jgi:hypothetical protein